MFFYVMIALLSFIYVVSFFLPSHWGVMCSRKSAPLGFILLGMFYFVWTIFVVKVISNDPMLALHEETSKTMAVKTKNLLLKDVTGEAEYDSAKMVLAQRQMFMITTIMVFFVEITLICWRVGSYFYKLEFDEAVKSHCTDHWHFKDSSITLLLSCSMVAMPI